MGKVTGEPSVERTVRQPARPGELLEVVRVILLLQGGILIANTIEAALFAVAFSGGITPTALATFACALAIFIARSRLDVKGRGRRAILIVEAVLVITLAIDMALALVLTHQMVPILSVITRFVLPVSVVALLGRVARAGREMTMLDLAA